MKINQWSDKEVEKHWDSVAEIYVKENERVKHVHSQRFNETIKLFDLKEGQKILNITSRDCEVNDYICREIKNAEVIHAEISFGLMKIAGRLRPNVNQVKIETYSLLPFRDEEFDRIISLETLEHVSEPNNFLSELYRVSRKDGRMLLTCPPATSEIPYRVYTFFFGGHGEGPHRFMRSTEVIKRLQLAGWKTVLHKGTLLIPFGPKWLQNFGESVINRFQNSFISELGIRQFYVCEK
jgi:SAM-dependent methyltransferase